MVRSFAAKKGLPLATDNEADLLPVMLSYENDIEAPLRNLMLGDLLHAFLIQIQKTKVDVETAMAALDKLLSANELNFALLTIIPAVLFARFLVMQARLFWLRQRGLTRETLYSHIREELRRIERLLNGSITRPSKLGVQGLRCRDQGYILIALHFLRQKATGRLPSARQEHMFLEDLSELESTRLSAVQRVGVVQRMHRTYSFMVPAPP